ncbi:hypothetical protein GGR92_002988 [Spirosoma lacussanchae]|uniref:hypothetical protein n=1 Tax=Spirosoma lacussanchae TaxID=1884249 RepID=UPI001107ED48|nr:hypothetical protein [Spirosoma lacussanchae]
MTQPAQPVEQAIEALAQKHPGWGFWKILYRLYRLNYGFNGKQVWRVYWQMGLNLPDVNANDCQPDCGTP